MEIESRELRLRDGRQAIIRSAKEADSLGLLTVLRDTNAETDFMARYPDEIRFTVEQEAEYLRAQREAADCCLLVAEVDGRLVGSAGFAPVSRYERCRHRAELGIALLQAYWGEGLGSALMELLVGAARAAGYRQMELDVVKENTRAQRLYARFGFVICGCRPRAFCYRDGREADELMMTLDLSAEG